MGWVLGVDFGTSFTTAAVADGDRVYVVEIDSSRYLPSVVGLDEDGVLLTGRRAVSLAWWQPGRAERLPKRQVGQTERLLLGEREVAVVDLVAEILRRVSAEAIRRQDKVAPARLVLTHPVRWGQAELAVLTAAAKAAGLPAPEFVAEPVAAALWYARDGGPVPDGAAVAVYDLGGGTFDVAVLRRRGDSYETLADGGDPRLGGEDFDEALADLVATHAAALDAAGWRTALDSPANAELLRQAVVEAKHQLSEQTTHRVMLPGLLRSPRVTRSEFVDAIDPLLRAATAILRDTITTAGLTPADLAAVYLTGGSSRIPHVTDTVTDTLGLPRPPRTSDDPKAVVAQGATQLSSASAARRPSLPTSQPSARRATAPVQNVEADSLRARRVHGMADEQPIWTAAFSPVGQCLAVGGDSALVTLWDISDPTRWINTAKIIGDGRRVLDVAFSPDGSLLAVGARDDTVQLWDVAKPPAPARLATLAGHKDWVRAVAFSPDGRLLATGSDDKAVGLWDVSVPSKPVRRAEIAHGYGVGALAFSPRRRFLVTGSTDGRVRLWHLGNNPAQPRQQAELRCHMSPVSALALSPDARRLVTGSNTGEIAVWSVENPSQPGRLATLAGHKAAVTAVAFTPGGRTFVTASADRTVKLWDATGPDGAPVVRMTLPDHHEVVRTAAFSPDGTLLATGGNDRRVLLWALEADPQTAALSSWATPSTGANPDTAPEKPEAPKPTTPHAPPPPSPAPAAAASTSTSQPGGAGSEMSTAEALAGTLAVASGVLGAAAWVKQKADERARRNRPWWQKMLDP